MKLVGGDEDEREDTDGTARPPGRRGQFSSHEVAALANLVGSQYDAVLARLSARPKFRPIDPQLLHDAVTDAIVECAIGSADEAYLALVAARNLLNLLRSEGRQKARERKVAEAAGGGSAGEPVELRSAAGNVLQNEEAERTGRERQALLDLLPDPRDRRVLELQLANERRTTVFAEVLGLGHLPPAEQRREVKRAKDRIGKVVRRGVRVRGPDAGEAGHG